MPTGLPDWTRAMIIRDSALGARVTSGNLHVAIESLPEPSSAQTVVTISAGVSSAPGARTNLYTVTTGQTFFCKDMAIGIDETTRIEIEADTVDVAVLKVQSGDSSITWNPNTPLVFLSAEVVSFVHDASATTFTVITMTGWES